MITTDQEPVALVAPVAAGQRVVDRRARRLTEFRREKVLPARPTTANVDLSEAVISANRKKLLGATFERVDLEKEPMEGEFDLVVCSEVLEHCEDQLAAMANLRRMTARHLIVSVPAGPVFPIDRAMGHHFHFTSESLRILLERGGFEVRFIRRWGFPFHSLYKAAINIRPEQTMDSFAGGSYGALQRLTGNLLRYLFYLNTRGVGWQLFALASVRRSSSI